jgi:predicted nucleic acid-binding protein
MASEPQRIYLDSCGYISAIQETAGRYEVLRDLIQDAMDGKVWLVASALVLAEVVKIHECGETTEADEKKIRDFFENPFIKVRSVDREVAKEAAALVRKHSIKPPDAIHVATAIMSKCVCFQTYDGAGRRGRKLLPLDGKMGVPPLRICEPYSPSRQEKKQGTFL